MDLFNVTGAALTSMSEQDFQQRAPQVRNTSHKKLENKLTDDFRVKILKTKTKTEQCCTTPSAISSSRGRWLNKSRLP